jgi:CRISPR-associated exonuclease Cas4
MPESQTALPLEDDARPTPDAPSGRSLADLRIGGTEMHYFVLCPRKLWWFSHGLEQEHSGGASSTGGQENVALGTLLHEGSYPDKKRKDLLIDDLIRLDFTDAGAVHEVKKSKGGARAERATLYQLLYYLYYLKHEKGIQTSGVIDYPKERRRQTVELTPEREAEIETLIAQLAETRELPTPPDVPEPMNICRKCAYQELCWG